jgi:NAD(P)-dependent dehydrogenase (short-subunit alcohol dehydrogenase family)
MPKTIVITGASNGIGAAAAQQLHRDGHCVVVVGRSPGKTEAIAREISADHFLADFSRLDDVRQLAADLDRAYPRIDVLANNAGGIFGDRAKTADGFEKTFQVNHLAPFLLTRLLLDKLIQSRASVIQTSSSGARLFGKLAIDDLDHDRDFTAQLAYGTAKLENILFTRELDRRYRGRGISAAAFHPGAVATSFATESDSFMKRIYNSRVGRAFMVTPEKGASQLVWLAQSVPGTDWAPGTYYEKRKPARRNNPQALDDDLARQLWDRSEQLIAQKARLPSYHRQVSSRHVIARE